MLMFPPFSSQKKHSDVFPHNFLLLHVGLQPLGTKKIYNLSGQKNYATCWDKKKSRHLSGQKIMQPLRTKKIMQPLRTKKITQSVG